MAKADRRRSRGGRPSHWQNKPTQTIRVPAAFADKLLEVARALDSGCQEPIVIDPKSLSVRQYMRKNQISVTPPNRFSHAGHKVLRAKELVDFFQKYLDED